MTTINLGALGDAIYAKNAEIAQANAVVKELELEKRSIEEQLLSAMEASGTDIVRGAKATVSITDTVRAQIADFDAFSVFCLRKKALYLFERRISAVAYREMKELMKGKAIPGLSEFTAKRLNVRKL